MKLESLEGLSPIKFERFIYLKEVDSTNQYALLVPNETPQEPTCFYSFSQTKGRGQIGRFWYTGEEKNIAVTYLWSAVNILAKNQFVISMSFALAIYDFLELHGVQNVSIKWPNDIYVGNKKVAGILIQNSLRSSHISTCYLGVGLNINERSFPTDIPNPTSLALEKDQSYKLVDLIHQITEATEKRLNQILLRSRAAIQDEYLNRLYRKDTAHPFLIDTQEYTGIIRGITEEGKLKLEIEGEVRLLNFREVSYVI